jgi:hypothetical protein
MEEDFRAPPGRRRTEIPIAEPNCSFDGPLLKAAV